MRTIGICLLHIIAILVFAKATPRDCGSKIGSIVSVEVSNCNDDDPKCVLRRNSNATIKLTFNLKDNVETVKALVYGVVLDVPVPFNIPNPDGCINSGLTCPLESNQTYVYQTTLPVLKKYPRLSVEIKWELQNEQDNNIICVMIPAKIQ